MSLSVVCPMVLDVAGWAYVVVTNGNGKDDVDATCIREDWGKVQEDKLSSNVAELRALVELLKWLKDEDPNQTNPIMIRTDSTYAANVARGKCACNTTLGRTAKKPVE